MIDDRKAYKDLWEGEGIGVADWNESFPMSRDSWRDLIRLARIGQMEVDPVTELAKLSEWNAKHQDTIDNLRAVATKLAEALDSVINVSLDPEVDLEAIDVLAREALTEWEAIK